MSLKAGKLSIGEMRTLLNKKAGMNVAHDLKEENPTEVTEWISTGSTWLDSIVCRGKKAGIPVGAILRSIDGIKVATTDAAIVRIRSYAPGATVSVVVDMPTGGSKTFKVTLGSAPSL